MPCEYKTQAVHYLRNPPRMRANIFHSAHGVREQQPSTFCVAALSFAPPTLACFCSSERCLSRHTCGRRPA